MEGFVGRRGLIEPKRLRALSQRSNLKGFLQLGSHLGAILATGFALRATWGGWWVAPAFIAHGILLNFLYAGQHELSHSTVFKSRWLNEAVGRAIGFLMFYPRDFDQIQHFAHHRHTQDWAKDGELDRPPYTLSGHLIYLAGFTYWTSRLARILRFAWGRVPEPYIPPGKHALVIGEARWLLAGYAAIAGPDPRVQHPGEHPHHAHQRRDALDGLEHAVPYRAPHLSGSAVSRPARPPCRDRGA
jgi:fatty acid desaturase